MRNDKKIMEEFNESLRKAIENLQKNRAEYQNFREKVNQAPDQAALQDLKSKVKADYDAVNKHYQQYIGFYERTTASQPETKGLLTQVVNLMESMTTDLDSYVKIIEEKLNTLQTSKVISNDKPGTEQNASGRGSSLSSKRDPGKLRGLIQPGKQELTSNTASTGQSAHTPRTVASLSWKRADTQQVKGMDSHNPGSLAAKNNNSLKAQSLILHQQQTRRLASIEKEITSKQDKLKALLGSNEGESKVETIIDNQSKLYQAHIELYNLRVEKIQILINQAMSDENKVNAKKLAEATKELEAARDSISAASKSRYEQSEILRELPSDQNEVKEKLEALQRNDQDLYGHLSPKLRGLEKELRYPKTLAAYQDPKNANSQARNQQYTQLKFDYELESQKPDKDLQELENIRKLALELSKSVPRAAKIAIDTKNLLSILQPSQTPPETKSYRSPS